MIIVSGPDNSGKTTLVKRLVEELGLNNLEKCKSLPLWKHRGDYRRWIVDTIENAGPRDIVDRCLIDEYVYGPVMRGKVCFDALDEYIIENALKGKNILFVITNPGAQAIEKTFHEREQYPQLKENLRILERFYYIINREPFNWFPHYIFDYRFDPDYDLVKHVVLSHIFKEEHK